MNNESVNQNMVFVKLQIRLSIRKIQDRSLDGTEIVGLRMFQCHLSLDIRF